MVLEKDITLSVPQVNNLIVKILEKHYNSQIKLQKDKIFKKDLIGTKKQAILTYIGGKKPNKLNDIIWKRLHPAYYQEGLSNTSYNQLKKDNPEKHKDYIKNWDTNGLNFSCGYTFINRLASYGISSNGPTKKDFSFDKISCIVGYVEKKTKRKDVLQFISKLNTTLPDSIEVSSFPNTVWYGYYRTRHPETHRIIISKCKMQIDNKNVVEIINTTARNFYNYKGKATLTSNRQLMLELNYMPNTDKDKTYILISLPRLPNREEPEFFMYGIYFQGVQATSAARAGTMVFQKSHEKWENMKTELMPITTSSSSNQNAFPFKNVYNTPLELIKRSLFHRGNNFISTPKNDVSTSQLLMKQIKNWDGNFSTKGRPLYDIYVSCPIEYANNDTSELHKMEASVTKLVTQLKSSIKFPNYSNITGLRVRSPFDQDKISVKDKMIDPNIATLEIENSKLFVMYYPDTSVISSCIIEAAWAIRAGICCLFIIDNENNLPRYLRKRTLTPDYPIHYCKNFDPSDRNIHPNLGRSISFS